MAIDQLGRREFITLLGGAAAWPLVARAQQPARVHRIGVLMNLAFDDPEGQARVAAFMQGLQEWGWAVGRNVRVDLRWGAGDAQRFRAYADELVALGPDILLASGATTVAPLQQATRTVPIVFVNVTDPVGASIVESLARPGGNVTGFALFEFGISAKWIELLKELSPRLTRVGILRDPINPAAMGLLGAIQSVAPSFGVELRPIAVRDPSEIERAFAAFAQTSIGGVIVLTGGAALVHRASIITLAAQHRLPAVYAFRYHVVDGGLISAARLPNSGISETAVNASLAFIEGAKPQGEVECALVIQMACTHGAAMAVLKRLAGAHGFERNVAVMASAASRLLRAYTTQVESLRRLRNGGSQFVRVEHVHVNEGGQAVIGPVAVDRTRGVAPTK